MNNSLISCKITEFGHPLCMGNRMPCCKERHPLLLKYFITFLRCIRMISIFSDSILKSVIVHMVSFLLKSTLKIHGKCQSFGTRFFKGNGMMCCKQQHPLLLDCLTTFPRYIRIVGRANNSTFKPLMVNTLPLLLKTALNFHVKHQLFSSLYKQETGYCDARRDTHCYLNAS